MSADLRVLPAGSGLRGIVMSPVPHCIHPTPWDVNCFPRIHFTTPLPWDLTGIYCWLSHQRSPLLQPQHREDKACKTTKVLVHHVSQMLSVTQAWNWGTKGHLPQRNIMKRKFFSPNVSSWYRAHRAKQTSLRLSQSLPNHPVSFFTFLGSSS